MIVLNPSPLPSLIIRHLAEIIRIEIVKLFSPDKDTRNIIFFGLRESGKTTMWKLLQDKFIETGYKATTSIETIDSFNLTINEKTITIKKSFDGSGKHEQTDNFYDSSIKDFVKRNKKTNIFVYYLVNIRDAQNKEKDIRAQLRKLDQTVYKIKTDNKNKQINVGLALVLTNFDDTREIDKSAIPSSILNFKFKNISFKDILTFDKHKENDINNIKKHIIKGYEK